MLLSHIWLCLKSLSQFLLLVDRKKRLEERNSLLITNKDTFLRERPAPLAWAICGVGCPKEILVIMIISSLKTVSSEPALRMDTHAIQYSFVALNHHRKTHEQATLIGFVLLSFVLKFLSLFFPISSSK